MSVILISACGGGIKDYADATPLSTITTTTLVKPLWSVETGKVAEFQHAQFPTVVDNDEIFIINAQGDVSALVFNSGELKWLTALNEVLTGGPGVSASLVFVGTRKAELIALNRTNGVEVWRQKMSNEMLALPQVMENRLVVQTIDGKITALNAETGQQLWRYDHPVPKLTLRGTSVPIIIGNKVLAGFADGKLVKLSLETGELQWETTVAVPRGRTDLERLVDIDGLFNVNDDIIYVSSYQGGVAAVSLDTGNILWARDMSSYVGVTVDKKQIYISDTTGRVWALDNRTGATLWRQDKLEGREISVSAVIGNDIVVADYDGYVHWLSKDDGKFVARQNLDLLWQEFNFDWVVDGVDPDELAYGVHRSVTSAPVVIENMLYLRDNLGALTVFEVSSNKP